MKKAQNNFKYWTNPQSLNPATTYLERYMLFY